MANEDIYDLRHLGQSEQSRLEIPAGKLPPGIKNHLVVVADVPGEKRSRKELVSDQAERPFKVHAYLSKTPPASSEIKGDFTEADGDSFFIAPAGIKVHRIDTSWGRYYIHQNGRGELSFATFECSERNTLAAGTRFLTALGPFLDHLSYIANVPVHIAMIRVEDVNNHVTSLIFAGPHLPVSLGSFADQFPAEMKPVYAMYREAKNASSDFYKFLCLYKILEGLLGKLRGLIFVRAKKEKGFVPKMERELIPPNDYYPDNIKRFAGTSIKALFDDVLTPQFRNAIAHFRLDDGFTLDMSDPAHQSQYADLVLVMEECVRVVIHTHETLLRQVG